MKNKEVYDYECFQVIIYDKDNNTHIDIYETISDLNLATGLRMDVEVISPAEQWEMIFRCFNRLLLAMNKINGDIDDRK